MVLPGLGLDGIMPAAERMRAAVAALSVIVPDLDGEERVISGLTASVGAAVFPVHGTDRTSLLLAADAALYEAKTAGRDRTRVADETPRPALPMPRPEGWTRLPLVVGRGDLPHVRGTTRT
ncbi:MAG: diguanylate cyclase, partial [Pseudonocardiaceae bacterium]|nr:diguanylate cyclase [Pseudonocardiaceae bacterium]